MEKFLAFGPFDWKRLVVLTVGMVGLAVLTLLPAYATRSAPPPTTSLPLANAPLVGAGQSWFPLDYGFDPFGLVQTIAVDGSNVYVGGALFNACGNAACDNAGIPLMNLAKWDGSAWSQLGYGFDGQIYDIAVSGGDVYVVGTFTHACGNIGCVSDNMDARFVAKWNGTTWSALGNGFDNGALAVAVSGSDVYAGGAFEQICGNAPCDSGNTTAHHVAHWNGSAWGPVGNGVDNLVRTIAFKESEVYFGGGFQILCGPSTCDSSNTRANGIAKWDGAQWTRLDFGVNGSVQELATDGTNLYLGGSFDQICGDDLCTSNNNAVNYLAKWDGSNFLSLGNGVDLPVSALMMDGADLYAGGDFRYTCGTDSSNCMFHALPVNRIAKWNGSAWSRLEFGFDNAVTSIAKSANGVVAGGSFVSACGDRSCNFPRTMNQVAEYRPCSTLPDKPQLRAPQNNQLIFKPNQVFSWGSAVCADMYSITVKNTTLHTTPVKAGDIANVQYKAHSLPNGKYKWFIKACNSAGCIRSAAWKFTLQ